MATLIGTVITVLNFIGKPFFAVLDWIRRRRQAGSDFRRAEVVRRREILVSALNALTMAMQKIEYDWARGLTSAQRVAREAAFEAEALAQQIDDERARGLLLAWKVLFDGAPHGYQRGSTSQAEAMRGAYREAASRLGELIREA